ncbi:DUF2252 domain-containing protein [Streptacidiphilus sp. 4-A2]|nr:DUF2252 domain-containing protein [Streptacidiphilus sp. 4-A2]
MRRTAARLRRTTVTTETSDRTCAHALGKAVRKRVPRSLHSTWAPSDTRQDPVAILLKEAESRIPELASVRHARMAGSLSAYFRGTPAVMAADLAGLPHTGLAVQLSGDAHLSNFGLFASPERTLVFDLNDFDETLPGPFEWAVKRLAASVAVAAYDNNSSRRAARSAAAESARSYRTHMRKLADRGNSTCGTSAQQTRADFDVFTKAIRDGRIPATES